METATQTVMLGDIEAFVARVGVGRPLVICGGPQLGHLYMRRLDVLADEHELIYYEPAAAGAPSWVIPRSSPSREPSPTSRACVQVSASSGSASSGTRLGATWRTSTRPSTRNGLRRWPWSTSGRRLRRIRPRSLGAR